MKREQPFLDEFENEFNDAIAMTLYRANVGSTSKDSPWKLFSFYLVQFDIMRLKDILK